MEKKIFSGSIIPDKAKEISHYFEGLMEEMVWLAKMAHSLPEAKIQTALDIVSREYDSHQSEAIGMIINAGDIKFAGVILRIEVGAYIESVGVRARLLAWVVQMATSDPDELDAVIGKFRDQYGGKAANTVLGRILEAEEAVHRGHWGNILPEDMGFPVAIEQKVA